MRASTSVYLNGSKHDHPDDGRVLKMVCTKKCPESRWLIAEGRGDLVDLRTPPGKHWTATSKLKPLTSDLFTLSSSPTFPRSLRLPTRSTPTIRYNSLSAAMASSRPQSLLPPRPNSNPFVASPLQTSFPALENLSSSPESPTPEGVAIRSSRPTENKARMRTESRSSSVPVSLQVPRTWVRATSPQPQDGSKSSVKHLTCFWWKEKGACRFSDEECL